MRRPARIGAADPPDAAPRATLTSPAFLTLFCTFFVALSAGLTVIANLKHLRAGDAASAGVSAVAWFAIANAAGRIAWGRIFDRVSPPRAIAADLGLSGLLFALAPLFLGGRGGPAVFAAIAGSCYGGMLAMHPAIVARLWGQANFQRVYGWLAAAHFPATLMPVLAGFVYDRTGSPSAWLWTVSALCFAGVAIVTMRARGRVLE